MSRRTTLLALGLPAITLFGASSQAAPPPNVPIVYAREAVAGCALKGVITVNLTQVHSDVQSVRSPSMRLRVAKLGGNVVFIQPGTEPAVEADNSPAGPRDGIRNAMVYSCSSSVPAKQ